MDQRESSLGRWGILCLVALTACGEVEGGRPPNPDEIPKLETLPESKVMLGFELGILREERTVPAFRMTKTPISVRSYKQCVSAGGCSAPASSDVSCRGPVSVTLYGRSFDGAEELPVTCTTPEQAAAYCRWIGGRLPTTERWLYAARGTGVRRYPWGSRGPRCGEHPFARADRGECDSAAAGLARFLVATHPKGASPVNIEDVLVAESELVAQSIDAPSAVCAGKSGVCLATGQGRGAIDNFAPYLNPKAKDGKSPPVNLVYTFRCALEAK
jgi:hypothetical protein